MRCPYILIFAACVFSALGCEEDEGSGINPEVTYTYSEFAVFDTTGYVFSKRDYPGSASKIPEPLVNWEQSLGEPFFDVNGDGIYDPAVDSFVISPDPDRNQDLNQNGEYDGPDDPWSPGIPFDDIDGNGEFREDPGDHISGYEIGLPYADFNKNNIHDGDLKAVYGVMQWLSGPWSSGYIAYYVSPCGDAVFRFVSDSGLTYDLYFLFESSMSALIEMNDGLYYRIDPVVVRILQPGMIEEENRTELTVSGPSESFTYWRTTILGALLEVDNVTYSPLVKVILEDLDDRYVFYFARNTGLIAYQYSQNIASSLRAGPAASATSEYYFRPLGVSHSLVFPTTR